MPSNPRQFQTMYLRASLGADSYVRRPSGPYYGFWTEYNQGAFADRARYMGPIPATQSGLQTQIRNAAFTAVPAATTQYFAIGQYCSDPLESVALPAARWTLSFASQMANSTLTFKWQVLASLYVVNGRTGERRATIFSNDSAFTVTSGVGEYTYTVPLLGQSAELVTGDYLALEIGFGVENSGGAAIVPDLAIFSDGTDPINANFIVTSSPQALLVSPVPIVRVLPYPNEQPNESVTEDEARSIAVDAFPPGILHEFGSPGVGQQRSPDAQFMDWCGTLFKRFGFDFIDVWTREMDPAQAYLKLDDWRDLYQIISNPQKRGDLAALVIARLRELGQASTLYGIAASVGTILGYVTPPQLELLEYDATTARNALQYVAPIGAPLAIPVAASFAGALRIETPYLYDGGHVWASGARLQVTLSIPAGKALFVRLTAPDGYQKTWSPVTALHEVDAHVLFAVEMSGHPVHGIWSIEVYRSGGAAVSLVGLSLYVPGAPRTEALGIPAPPMLGPPWPLIVPNASIRCGLGRHRQWWGAYADPALIGVRSAADLREARSAISRLRHGYQRGDLILTKQPIPGTAKAIPGSMIPG